MAPCSSNPFSLYQSLLISLSWDGSGSLGQARLVGVHSCLSEGAVELIEKFPAGRGDRGERFGVFSALADCLHVAL